MRYDAIQRHISLTNIVWHAKQVEKHASFFLYNVCICHCCLCVSVKSVMNFRICSNKRALSSDLFVNKLRFAQSQCKIHYSLLLSRLLYNKQKCFRRFYCLSHSVFSISRIIFTFVRCTEPDQAKPIYISMANQ